MCKCEVRKFDKNGSYQKAYPHIANRYTYAWKPLVIQVSLILFGYYYLSQLINL